MLQPPTHLSTVKPVKKWMGENKNFVGARYKQWLERHTYGYVASASVVI